MTYAPKPVMTENESNNIRMLEINKHLGFRTQSTELDYTLDLL